MFLGQLRFRECEGLPFTSAASEVALKRRPLEPALMRSLLREERIPEHRVDHVRRRPEDFVGGDQWELEEHMRTVADNLAPICLFAPNNRNANTDRSGDTPQHLCGGCASEDAGAH